MRKIQGSYQPMSVLENRAPISDFDKVNYSLINNNCLGIIVESSLDIAKFITESILAPHSFSLSSRNWQTKKCTSAKTLQRLC
jgi:hypothetical protein